MSFTPWQNDYATLREAAARQGKSGRSLVWRDSLAALLDEVDEWRGGHELSRRHPSTREGAAVGLIHTGAVVGCAAKGCDRANPVFAAMLGLDGKSYCPDHVGPYRRASLRTLVARLFA